MPTNMGGYDDSRAAADEQAGHYHWLWKCTVHLEEEAAPSRRLLVIQPQGAEERSPVEGQEPQKGGKRRFLPVARYHDLSGKARPQLMHVRE